MKCPLCNQEIKPQSISSELSGLHLALDVGHGWGMFGAFDVGAMGNGTTEYELNFQTAVICHDLLTKRGATVSIFNYPRSDLARLSLTDKGRRAASVGANLFVSIHHNAFNGEAQGTETLVHTKATTSDLAFAECVQESLVASLKLTNRGVKRQALGVLAGVSSSIPAILTEGFFIDSRDFHGKIPTELSERYATGLANGVEKYWKSIKA